MGFIRKVTSVGTLGVVDYRTPAQKARRNARLGRRHDRLQTGLLAAQAHQGRQQVAGLGQIAQQQQQQQQQYYPAPQAVPAGWFADPQGQPVLRYWDGMSWTSATAPIPIAQ